MDEWKIWLKLCILLIAIILILGAILIISYNQGGTDKTRIKQLLATIAELEERNKRISDRVAKIVEDTQRQFDAATDIARESREVTTGLTTAIEQSESLTERIIRADQLAEVLVTAITGLIEIEQLTSLSGKDFEEYVLEP